MSFHSNRTAIAGNPANMPVPVCHEEPIDGFGTVTVVRHFLPGYDRLLLDFDADQKLPSVTLDMSVERGSTAVMGDGKLMAVLRNVTGIAVGDVQLRNLDGTEAWDADRDRTAPDIPVVDAFDPEKQVIEVQHDPGSPVEIAVQDFADGSGATIVANGKPVMAVKSAHGVQSQDVVLVPRREN